MTLQTAQLVQQLTSQQEITVSNPAQGAQFSWDVRNQKWLLVVRHRVSYISWVLWKVQETLWVHRAEELAQRLEH